MPTGDAHPCPLRLQVEHLARVVGDLERSGGTGAGGSSAGSAGSSRDRGSARADTGAAARAAAGAAESPETPAWVRARQQREAGAVAERLDDEEGGEEDAALMQQLAAALSQRIKSIYDV